MKFIELLREYINEIVIDSRGKLGSNDGNNFILKSNGPWIKALGGGLRCYSIYRTVKTGDVDPIEIIRSIKNPLQKTSVKIPKGMIDEILEKGVEKCVPWIEGLEFDIVTTPQSSKTLGIRFGKKIAERLDKQFIPSGTLKDLDSAKIKSELPASYSEKSVKGLERSLERMKEKSPDGIKKPGEGTLQKHFRPRDRKFIQDWQKTRDLGNLKEGNRVLLVDDVLSDGTTLGEMSRVLRESGVIVVGCLTLFRTT
jgi:adenine/guanine phosphoribosyltransferase-like PRPP-binding protein